MTKTAKKRKPKAKNKAQEGHSECIQLLNDALKDQNLQLETGIQISFETGESRELIYLSMVSTKSGRPVKSSIVSQYCPICGKKQNPLKKKG